MVANVHTTIASDFRAAEDVMLRGFSLDNLNTWVLIDTPSYHNYSTATYSEISPLPDNQDPRRNRVQPSEGA